MNFVISRQIYVLFVVRIKNSGNLIQANMMRAKVVKQNDGKNLLLRLALSAGSRAVNLENEPCNALMPHSVDCLKDV